MTSWPRLMLGVPVAAAVVLWSAGLPGGSPSVGSVAAAAARPAGPAVAAGLPAPRPPKGNPAFDATFAGTKLNTKVWDTCYPLQPSFRGGCKNWGNAAVESEWYLPSQVQVSGGELHLVARRERTAGSNLQGHTVIYDCRSGMVTSYPSYKFEYGFVQIVADIPHSLGLWPALWLAATNGKYPPEMDIVESWGVNVQAGAIFHPVGAFRDRTLVPPKMTEGWQTYSLLWTKSKLVYYMGNQAVLTVTQRVPHQPMYFLADLAEYKPPRAGYCTGTMLVKSVKIWKL
jgi:hypothetical protein